MGVQIDGAQGVETNLNGRLAPSRQTVVYAADSQYWMHTYVSVFSLLTNNPDIPLEVRILAQEPNKQFFENIPTLQSLHTDADISWLPVDDALIENASSSISYITKATYYRLILARVLPDDVRRVLYIDGDTIVRGSLRSLFSIDIDDYVLAATPEYGTVPHNQRLGIPEGNPCFNAGVLLINLEKWRSQRVEERCFEFIRNNASDPSKLKYNDQDALNAVLTGQWKSIGPFFNFSPWTLNPQRLVDFDVHSQVGGLVPRDGPAIAHYAGERKPWQGGGLHPYENDYWRYRMQTPYANRFKYGRSYVFGSRYRVHHRLVCAVRELPGGHSLLRFARTRLRST
jgi:lipopolysaccharide biosynthesis glycosyltransferase